MALDVHIIERGSRLPEKKSSTGFGFGDEHAEIFRVVYTCASAYPQLAKMQDYYDDVLYEGKDLQDLAFELEKVISLFPINSSAEQGVRLELIAQAVAEYKAILLFAD